MRRGPIEDGEVLAGKYRVERMLGAGGMGIVLAAWHLELEQRVAIKLLRSEVAERSDSAERFRREARAAAKIKSEHVGRVLDVGTLEDGVPFMVMEYLDGHDLGDQLKQSGPLPTQVAVDYLLQTCEAVAEAHAAGIVHRDLKPANLFISQRPDGSQIIKVLDFGISKSLDSTSDALSLTGTASMIGSPLYMSPEQMQSARDVDARTDIWSLGAILYEALAGRPPYVADSMPQLCAQLLNHAPPALGQFRPDLPPGLEEVVGRCLERDRAFRVATVADMARELVPYGSPESRVHAERAQRVLGSTDISVTGGGGSLSTSVAGARTGPGTTTGGHGTLDSWGRTGSAASPAQSRLPWALLGGGLLVVGLGGGWYLLSRHAVTPPVPATASAPQAAVVPPPSASAPAAVAPVAEASVQTAKQPAAPEAGAVHKPAAARPRWRNFKHGGKKIRHVTGKPSATNNGTLIPNFGGRH